MARNVLFASAQTLIVAPLMLALLTNVGAQVMTSSNYQIESDSINTGGGLSSSTNYQLESTVGEQATGESDSTSYSLRSGYQQMQETYLAISAIPSVVMAPSIPGVAGGIANGSTTVTVTTDNLAGYELSIRAENDPAMQTGGGATIADYVPAGVAPDYSFTTGAADAHFGFSPEGVDIAQRYLDNGASCDQSGGSDTADTCWDGLTTSDVVIAAADTTNHPAGTETTVQFRVGVGGSVAQQPGSYVATTTITAVAL